MLDSNKNTCEVYSNQLAHFNRLRKIIMTKKKYYETITPDTSALVLVDHQIGLYTGVRDIPVDELKHNLIGLVGL
jgi:hypothetical protein